ncbi:ABC transporter ATP-binding protein [Polaromonas naphthalenivorans]|uniref:ABC transporter related protein n=1 Tax=Polaromonas naphthalenivorans (strain CJ2) TaxID=365044 RepID=A1VJN8_POLNA|nr:ABC transporter ATP-binding protein [Polaromonas naphthalenivorans]ABM35866.1 ABC transporter related protein [Polaromonas naphthalenivorans CJ2]
MSTALLDIEVRRKTFGDATVLQGIRLQISAGEIVSLVGASGCGKSTLLRIVAGLETAYQGRITLGGQPLAGLSRDVGFIFQEPRLFPWLSVAQNVAFSAGAQGARDPRVAQLLAEVGLAGLTDALPKQLSGGQAQRVAIARGLFGQPRLLLLDEPFSAVDAFTRMHLQDMLLDIARRHGTTLLLVTHDIDEAVYLADRVWVLDSKPGRLSADMAIDLPQPRQRDTEALAQRRIGVLHALQAVHAI